MNLFFTFLSIYLWVSMSVYVYVVVMEEDSAAWRKLLISVLAPALYPLLVIGLIVFFSIMLLFGRLDDEAYEML